MAVFASVALAACEDGGADSDDSDRRATTAPETESNAPRVRATRALFDGIDEDGPGCSVAIARDGEVFAEGYGRASIEDGTPNTPETVMDIASTSKQFTALAILLLADEGKVDLDDDIHEYVPELPDYGAEVTLRQMMHHQSGIPDYVGLLSARIADRTTADDALQALMDEPNLDFAPGERFSYSNSNYFLFSYVVDRVTGMSLPQFLQTRVFQPAGIDAVMDPVGDVPHKAQPYRPAGDGWRSAGSKWEQVGDGAIQTTPTELVKWASQYWDPTVGSAGVDRARLDGAVPSGGTSEYGAGIFRVTLPDGTKMLQHSGGWAGFSTTFALIPEERLAVAATCNGAGVANIGPQELLDIWR